MGERLIAGHHIGHYATSRSRLIMKIIIIVFSQLSTRMSIAILADI